MIVRIIGFLLVMMVVPEVGFSGSRPDAVVKKIRETSLAVLQTIYQSERAFLRAAAARAAGESHDPELIPLLNKATEDVYPTARLFALQGLLRVSPSEALKAARRMTDDTDIWVRSAAVEILGDEGREIDEVRKFLKSYDVPVRMAASSGLVKHGEGKYLEDVLEPLTHPVPDRRYQAIGYLGKIGTQEVLPHLAKLFDHTEPEMVFYSLKAVEGMTTPDMLPKLRELIQHDNSSVRYAAALAMGNLKEAEPDLIPLCADKDGMVKLSAAVALYRMGSSSCQIVFEELLQHPDFGVRSAMARVLGEISIPERERILKLALKDKHSRVRTASVRAVGMMGGPEAFPILMELLQDSLEVVRAYAAGNLIHLLRP
ncbi:MAG: HEAT repeat domain-containing protein [Nitrospina sp.]|jgi:HEAT repeat protein|nr:HEAT repeat domain-containing protein [Nitrospina sp.]MBT3510714.1 HEAT repeat domain-containing protein [Nitrospina sp.]MBT3875983.1 HEAT repeat domain-containing protein [Nitrospina sp.]MBT4048974.1 HEAT repeat domain-containing protein [Nitrospina sp.]MBT4557652.1 HEAT repeat domain-containing protein [Nitrospina sp.]